MNSRFLRLDLLYVQERPAQNFVQDAGLIKVVEACLSAARRFLGKSPPDHAAEPRDCPCRPRASQRIRVRVRVGIDDTRPAQSFVQDRPLLHIAGGDFLRALSLAAAASRMPRSFTTSPHLATMNPPRLLPTSLNLRPGSPSVDFLSR